MKIKRIIDISRRIHPQMPIWPGDKGVDIKRVASIRDGAVCNLSAIDMGLHTGTHVDAPFHFIDGGIDIGSLDLSRFIGMVKVFELDVDRSISYESIKNLPIEKDDIVFFKTANSNIDDQNSFITDFIHIDASAAKYLADTGIKAVGVDYQSVDGFNSESHPVHKILLRKGIGIMEGLYLKDVKAGEYFFSCLPLRIEGVDGSPARAVLLEMEI